MMTRFVRFSIALHLVGIAVVLVAWSYWQVVLTVTILDHLALVWGSLWPRSRLVGTNVRHLAELGLDAPVVALTFDDGPDPEVTPAVLDILDRYNARATFFCIGGRARRHPELIERIVAAGHYVENHTFNHRWYFCFLSCAAQAAEIDRTQATLAQTSGRRPRYFRAPAGLRNPWLDFVLARRELTLVSWTRRAFDTRGWATHDVVRRLTGSVARGDILLLHDGSSARGADGRPVVLSALPEILERLACRGLQARGLPESGGHD